jgi:hypothetical protein
LRHDWRDFGADCAPWIVSHRLRNAADCAN